jgi:hypothetical protein
MAAALLALLLAASASGQHFRLAPGQVLLSLGLERQAKWRVCATVWNVRQAEVALHVDAGAARWELRTKDLSAEACQLVTLPAGASVRLVSDTAAEGNFRVLLQAIEVLPEGT